MEANTLISRIVIEDNAASYEDGTNSTDLMKLG